MERNQEILSAEYPTDEQIAIQEEKNRQNRIHNNFVSRMKAQLAALNRDSHFATVDDPDRDWQCEFAKDKICVTTASGRIYIYNREGIKTPEKPSDLNIPKGTHLERVNELDYLVDDKTGRRVYVEQDVQTANQPEQEKKNREQLQEVRAKEKENKKQAENALIKLLPLNIGKQMEIKPYNNELLRTSDKSYAFTQKEYLISVYGAKEDLIVPPGWSLVSKPVKEHELNDLGYAFNFDSYVLSDENNNQVAIVEFVEQISDDAKKVMIDKIINTNSYLTPATQRQHVNNAYRRYKRSFSEQDNSGMGDVVDREIEKTPVQRETIEQIINIVNDERKKREIKGSPITSDQVHWYNYDDYKKNNPNSVAHFSQEHQAINVGLLSSTKNYLAELCDLETLLHELGHAISYQEAIISTDLYSHRVGAYLYMKPNTDENTALGRMKSQSVQTAFSMIDEAANEIWAVEQMDSEKIQNLPSYHEQFVKMRADSRRHPVRQKLGQMVAKRNNLRWGEFGITGELYLSRGAYFSNRRSLDKLFEIISERSGGRYSQEQLYQMLLNTRISGSFMPIARAIHETMGANAFRELGLASINEEDFRKFVDKYSSRPMSSDKHVWRLLNLIDLIPF